MSWLELWEFVQALPYDSMTGSAMAGDHTRRRWTEMHYMQASALSLMQYMTQVLWAGQGLEGKPPKLVPWTLPDLRTPEQLAEDEAREARQAAIRTRFYEATRPGAAADPDYARCLAQAREEHLRLQAQAAQTTEQGERWPPASDPSSPASFPTSRTSPPAPPPR
ncbi:hypothetical protein [Streptomyces similanensis]|uniref:Uncharacterized protein n=1 Tax=Streptomyces similanensis TaxID=1274988 RepID=A0ABP9LLW3_9ACTN